MILATRESVQRLIDGHLKWDVRHVPDHCDLCIAMTDEDAFGDVMVSLWQSMVFHKYKYTLKREREKHLPYWKVYLGP